MRRCNWTLAGRLCPSGCFVMTWTVYPSGCSIIRFYTKLRLCNIWDFCLIPTKVLETVNFNKWKLSNYVSFCSNKNSFNYKNHISTEKKKTTKKNVMTYMKRCSFHNDQARTKPCQDIMSCYYMYSSKKILRHTKWLFLSTFSFLAFLIFRGAGRNEYCHKYSQAYPITLPDTSKIENGLFQYVYGGRGKSSFCLKWVIWCKFNLFALVIRKQTWILAMRTLTAP